MTTALVIGLLATPSSGADSQRSEVASAMREGAAPVHSERERVATGAPSSTSLRGATQSRSDSCPSARKALTFYRSRVEFWRAKMGAGEHKSSIRAGACPRYLAHLWQRKAHAARVAFTRWHFEQYAWRSWLPEPYRSIFNCETHMNWRHNSGTYQGAPGFHYGTWDAYKPKDYPADAFDATPRQQFIVAQRVAAAVGFGAWGCYR